MFKGNDGRYYKLVGRLQKIKSEYIVSKKHSLYCYSDDCEDGSRIVDYIVYQGKKYAIGQFLRLGGMMGGYPIILDNGDIIGGYDAENYYNPLMIAIDDYGEYVRLYVDYGAIQDDTLTPTQSLQAMISRRGHY